MSNEIGRSETLDDYAEYWEAVKRRAVMQLDILTPTRLRYTTIMKRLQDYQFVGVDGLDSKTPRPHWKQPGLGLCSYRVS